MVQRCLQASKYKAKLKPRPLSPRRAIDQERRVITCYANSSRFISSAANFIETRLRNIRWGIDCTVNLFSCEFCVYFLNLSCFGRIGILYAISPPGPLFPHESSEDTKSG